MEPFTFGTHYICKFPKGISIQLFLLPIWSPYIITQTCRPHIRLECVDSVCSSGVAFTVEELLWIYLHTLCLSTDGVAVHPSPPPSAGLFSPASLDTFPSAPDLPSLEGKHGIHHRQEAKVEVNWPFWEDNTVSGCVWPVQYIVQCVSVYWNTELQHVWIY